MKPMTAARRVACAAAATATALALAAPAQAGVLVNIANSMPDCTSQSVSKPFTPFMDYADYFKVPGGDFESGSANWTLTGGASTVAAQEPWRVSGANHSTALSLPTGSSAASPVVCVGIDSPSVRLFARKTWDPIGNSALLVESVTEDSAGTVRRLPIGVVTGNSSWTPTSPMPLLASLVAALPGDQAPVQLRFTTLGVGTWQIDDGYVDPYHRCC